ncbi:MAG: GAF domain-containing protein [Candidatus Desulfatibia sp.]|uniref:GAF domain-containing protein n=1 Tax=Candidatus Desulfatibia sp. TaxID=3101189 RepID=UPI002F2D26B3
MDVNDKINIDIFKVITRAIAESNDLGIMANHLTQLLVGTLDLKGCTIFVLGPDTKELEVLASSGLSISFMSKGPVLSDKSVSFLLKGTPVVITDIAASDRLQYPQETEKEGIRAIASVPIMLYGSNIGVLRLYHHEPWDVSEQDLDSLFLLAEHIGLAMTYTRLRNALQSVKETITNIHTIWLNPGKK